MSDEPASYGNEDLVYVDPEKRIVIDHVTWTKGGNVEPREWEVPERNPEEDEKGKKRRRQKRFYPWGSYRTMKKLYRIEGKEKEEQGARSLDEAINLAVQEPYWD